MIRRSSYQKAVSAARWGNLKIALAVEGMLLFGSIGAVVAGCGSTGGDAAKGDQTPSIKLSVTTPAHPTPADETSEEETTAAEKPAAAKKEASRPPATKPSRSTTSARPPGNAARPKDVADWKREDYEAAVREHDPRLVAALQYFGGQFAGKESAANFLAKLLKSWFAETPAPAPAVPLIVAPRRQPFGNGNAVFVEAVIAALGANGTPRAKEILAGIVSGEVKTGDEEAAVAALKALAALPGPQSDDLLFRLATSPESSDVPDRQRGGANNLPSVALKQIAERGSESLSVRLAEAMLAPGTTKAVRDRLWTCLKRPRPENLAAQIMLYENPRSEQAIRDWLEQTLAADGSTAIAQLLGFPANGTASTAMGISPATRAEIVPIAVATSYEPYLLADKLWNLGVVTAIDGRLRELDALDGRTPLLGLAATIPNRAMRVAMLRTLQRHWDEGPKELKSLVAASDASIEPGFLVVVKMLRRDEPPKSTVPEERSADAAVRPVSRAATKTTAGRPAAGRSKSAVLREQVQIGQQWMAFSKELSLAACRRFRAAAAEASSQNKFAPNNSVGDAGLPFALHPRSEVLAAYRLDWPEDLEGKVPAAPTLRVRYLRARQKAAPNAVLSYYRRQISAGSEHALDGGGWIDRVTVDRQADRTSSIDVFVGKANKNVVGRMDQEQELTIEILAVECEAVVEAIPATAGQ